MIVSPSSLPLILSLENMRVLGIGEENAHRFAVSLREKSPNVTK